MPPLTDADIRAWLDMLGGDRASQLATVADLLSHAAEDHMHPDDIKVCLRAVRLLGGRVGKRPLRDGLPGRPRGTTREPDVLRCAGFFADDIADSVDKD